MRLQTLRLRIYGTLGPLCPALHVTHRRPLRVRCGADCERLIIVALPVYTDFKMRTSWLQKRSSDAVRTQMYYARKGLITEEMEYIARIEKISAELIRTEVARGRMIIPANIRHTNLEPMAIGIESKCKINANIGNSATTSNIDEELAKLRYSVKFGADTVMDLSTGGDIPEIRKAIIAASPV